MLISTKIARSTYVLLLSITYTKQILDTKLEFTDIKVYFIIIIYN